jgi:uncharacterized protein (DUF2236 family)
MSTQAEQLERYPATNTAGSAASANSAGLAGLDSVAWKVNCETVLLLGWGRAVLLQLAHPLVAAGVAEHSLFVREPHGRVKRLRQTVQAMLDLIFGTAEQAQHAADGINHIHDYVHGTLAAPAGRFPAGTHYSAHDPELLRWVQATLLESFPLTYERFVGPLSAEERDRYCREASGLEPLLLVPPGFFPPNTAELYAYMDEMVASGQIVVTDTARQLAREVLRPPLPSLPPPLAALFQPLVWPLTWLAALPTIGLLPPSIRRAYGFRWTRWHAFVLTIMSRAIRLLLPLTPPFLRFWPVAREAFHRSA